MKLNKNIVTLSIALLSLTMITNTRWETERDEPVLAEVVESPGNIVGSLFGGGYANRKRANDNNSSSRKKSHHESSSRSDLQRKINDTEKQIKDLQRKLDRMVSDLEKMD